MKLIVFRDDLDDPFFRLIDESNCMWVVPGQFKPEVEVAINAAGQATFEFVADDGTASSYVVMPDFDSPERKREVLPRQCGACGAEEGQLHDLYCDMERCPFCGGQLMSCDCMYKEVGFVIDPYHETAGLPVEIYANGLTGDLYEKWLVILNKKGRVPYIKYPVLCGRCGVHWPELFRASDEAWYRYIQPDMRNEVICWDCFSHIKRVMDLHAPDRVVEVNPRWIG